MVVVGLYHLWTQEHMLHHRQWITQLKDSQTLPVRLCPVCTHTCSLCHNKNGFAFDFNQWHVNVTQSTDYSYWVQLPVKADWFVCCNQWPSDVLLGCRWVSHIDTLALYMTALLILHTETSSLSTFHRDTTKFHQLQKPPETSNNSTSLSV